MLTFSRVRFVFITALLGCLGGGCIFDNNQPVAPLTMQYIGTQGDTVSPLAVLRFAFSDSLASPLDFDFSPSVAQRYDMTFNPARDTATLSFVEMLPGNTRYVLRLKSAIAAANGSTLSTGNDSTVLYTGAKEQEPNNTPALADTLKPPAIYGMLSEASDTDVYCVPQKRTALYFRTFAGQASFSVKDSMLRDVRPGAGSAGTADTFIVPDSTLFPIYVFVFSPIKGVACIYRFGIVP
jgi:hypothetical protein